MVYNCGYVKNDLTLNIRKWTCINGMGHNRDVNAANQYIKGRFKTCNGRCYFVEKKVSKLLKKKKQLRKLDDSTTKEAKHHCIRSFGLIIDINLMGYEKLILIAL